MHPLKIMLRSVQQGVRHSELHGSNNAEGARGVSYRGDGPRKDQRSLLRHQGTALFFVLDERHYDITTQLRSARQMSGRSLL